MPKGSELLNEAQRDFVAKFDLDPDDPVDTYNAINLSWQLGQMCGSEFLYEQDCDARPGFSSHRSCGPNGCPFVYVVKPSIFDEKYSSGGDTFYQDCLKYPVYYLPPQFINLERMRKTRLLYEDARSHLAGE